MLEDLSALIVSARAERDAISLDDPFVPDPKLWDVVINAYKAAGREKVHFVDNALLTTNKDLQFTAFHASEIKRIWAIWPYVSAIQEYRRVLNELKNGLIRSGLSANYIETKILKELPNKSWITDPHNPDAIAIDKLIKAELGLDNTEQAYFRLFLSDPFWSGIGTNNRTGKKLDRNEWVYAAIGKVGNWVANTSDRRGKVADNLAASDEFEKLMKQTSQSLVGKVGKNLIVYGAPGTGKSTTIEKRVQGVPHIRTVFHPETQNSDFFGCLKPTMKDGAIEYGFAPGPLALSLVAANKNTAQHHYLVIEELNRAPAAAVFGELFQLLDRDNTGRGKYEVDFPTPESATWFKAQGYTNSKLVLPQNLSIYATMNSADQGVYPLDTAFRRRWEQEYLPLAEGAGPQGNLSFTGNFGTQFIEWKPFISILNDHLLTRLQIAEDRLLGLWFVNEWELGGEIPAKILLYLLDDLLRHEGREVVFARDISTYGQLSKALADGKKILSDELLNKLEAEVNAAESAAALEEDEDEEADAGAEE